MKTQLAILVILATAAAALLASDEITISAALTALKNYASVSRTPAAIRATWNGQRSVSQTITCTTNATLVSTGEVSVAGWSYWRNISTNVNIFLSFGMPGQLLSLKPGEFAIFRLGQDAMSNGILALTTNGTALLEYTIMED